MLRTYRTDAAAAERGENKPSFEVELLQQESVKGGWYLVSHMVYTFFVCVFLSSSKSACIHGKCIPGTKYYGGVAAKAEEGESSTWYLSFS